MEPPPDGPAPGPQALPLPPATPGAAQGGVAAPGRGRPTHRGRPSPRRGHPAVCVGVTRAQEPPIRKQEAPRLREPREPLDGGSDAPGGRGAGRPGSRWPVACR